MIFFIAKVLVVSGNPVDIAKYLVIIDLTNPTLENDVFEDKMAQRFDGYSGILHSSDELDGKRSKSDRTITFWSDF